jgi:hypothetical protein
MKLKINKTFLVFQSVVLVLVVMILNSCSSDSSDSKESGNVIDVDKANIVVEGKLIKLFDDYTIEEDGIRLKSENVKIPTGHLYLKLTFTNDQEEDDSTFIFFWDKEIDQNNMTDFDLFKFDDLHQISEGYFRYREDQYVDEETKISLLKHLRNDKYSLLGIYFDLPVLCHWTYLTDVKGGDNRHLEQWLYKNPRTAEEVGEYRYNEHISFLQDKKLFKWYLKEDLIKPTDKVIFNIGEITIVKVRAKDELVQKNFGS